MDKQETKQKLQPKAEPIDNAVPLESRIHLLTIIGEVEGHESLGDRTKSTKYEEILPRLALIEDDEQIEGILILLHTVGGDVEAGLAIADDRITQQANRITGSGRRAFHRCSSCRLC